LHEKLPVVETNAVIHPRAMMIHVQDADIAN